MIKQGTTNSSSRTTNMNSYTHRKWKKKKKSARLRKGTRFWWEIRTHLGSLTFFKIMKRMHVIRMNVLAVNTSSAFLSTSTRGNFWVRRTNTRRRNSYGTIQFGRIPQESHQTDYHEGRQNREDYLHWREKDNGRLSVYWQSRKESGIKRLRSWL